MKNGITKFSVMKGSDVKIFKINRLINRLKFFDIRLFDVFING